jgi:hypothetical protein
MQTAVSQSCDDGQAAHTSALRRESNPASSREEHGASGSFAISHYAAVTPPRAPPREHTRSTPPAVVPNTTITGTVKEYHMGKRATDETPTNAGAIDSAHDHTKPSAHALTTGARRSSHAAKKPPAIASPITSTRKPSTAMVGIGCVQKRPTAPDETPAARATLKTVSVTNIASVIVQTYASPITFAVWRRSARLNPRAALRTRCGVTRTASR